MEQISAKAFLELPTQRNSLHIIDDLSFNNKFVPILKGHTFSGDVSITSVDNNSTIYISDCVFEKNLSFTNFSITTKRSLIINIKNCSIKYGELIISGTEFTKISFNGENHFKIKIHHSTIETIEFVNFNGDEVQLLDLKGTDVFLKNSSMNKFDATSVSLKGLFELTNNKKIGFLNIEICSAEENIFIRSLDENRNSQIDSIRLRQITGYRADVYIENISTNKIDLTGVNNNTVQLYDSTVKELSINRFRNMGTLSIMNIHGLENLNIAQSFMGKTSFLQVDLEKTENVNITNSLISEVSYASITFPKKINGTNLDEINQIVPSKLGQVKEAVRQLKMLAKNQSDVSNFLQYKSYEIELNRKLMTSNAKNVKGLISKVAACTEQFALWVGNINNHGLNWGTPALAILITSIYFAFVIVWLGNKNLSIWNTGVFF